MAKKQTFICSEVACYEFGSESNRASIESAEPHACEKEPKTNRNSWFKKNGANCQLRSMDISFTVTESTWLQLLPQKIVLQNIYEIDWGRLCPCHFHLFC